MLRPVRLEGGAWHLCHASVAPVYVRGGVWSVDEWHVVALLRSGLRPIRSSHRVLLASRGAGRGSGRKLGWGVQKCATWCRLGEVMMQAVNACNAVIPCDPGAASRCAYIEQGCSLIMSKLCMRLKDMGRSLCSSGAVSMLP